MKTSIIFILIILALSACQKERAPISYVLTQGIMSGSLGGNQVSEIISEHIWIESQDKRLAAKYMSKLDSMINRGRDSTAIDLMRRQFVAIECRNLKGSPE